MESLRYNFVAIKLESYYSGLEFLQRGLFCAADWLSQLTLSLRHIRISDPPLELRKPTVKGSEYDRYNLALSYFSDQQYARCAFYLRKAKSRSCKFLRDYALYLNLEQKKLSTVVGTNIFESEPEGSDYIVEMTDLYQSMKQQYIDSYFDGYQLYVYGLVLKRMGLDNEAKSVLIEAVHALPMNWSAWKELWSVISNRDVIQSIKLPNHWMKDLFFANLFLHMHMDGDAVNVFQLLLANGFHNFNYLLVQRARCLYNLKDMQGAYNMLMKVRKDEPYNFFGMDLLSKILSRPDADRLKLIDTEDRHYDLGELTTDAIETNVCLYETHIIMGNYYASKKESSRAIVSFKTAIQINPYVNTAWTYLGQELLQVRNTSAAILAYRRAILCKPTDYYALFGLAQTHEVHRMPSFALYYIKKAITVNPEEPKFLMWMGGIYERSENHVCAIKCYNMVKNMKNPDPMCLIHLAKLYALTDTPLAVKTHEEIVSEKLAPFSAKYQKEYLTSCTYLHRYYNLQKAEEKAAHYSKLALKAAELPPSTTTTPITTTTTTITTSTNGTTSTDGTASTNATAYITIADITTTTG